MASWKLIGVVPDSEDEDDLDLETQSDTNNANVHENDDLEFGENDHESKEGVIAGVYGTQLELDEVYTNTNEPNEYDKHEEKEENGRRQISGIPGKPNEMNTCASPLISNGNCGIGWKDRGGLSEDELAIAPIPQPARKKPVALDNGGVPASSPSQPLIFRVPSLEDDDSSLPIGIQAISQLPGESGEKNSPVEDDISTSYVRISTPHSSPLSSPPGSQSSRFRSERTQKSPMSVNLQHGLESVTNRAASQATVEELVNSRRSFRQRNPIQLHPYMLEQEKYRQTLRDRGVKPMRITQTQEENESNSRNSPSPAPESQNTEIAGGASQPMDFDWDPPSSPPERVLSRNPNHTEKKVIPPPIESTVDDGSTASDDEFPDVNELLRKPKATLNTGEPKRRLKKYSLKHGTKSNLVTRPTFNGYHDESSIFDIPVSPPVTSPLLGNASRKNMSRTMSLSSAKEAMPDSSATEHQFRVPAGIQTPATSAVKPPSKSIPVVIDLDEDDPFASDHDISSTAESSSEESVEMIRKVSKKIRGVLPASHLRLNHDSKKPAMSSVTRRHSIDAASTTPQMRRGVAIPRISATATRRNTENHEIPVLSDDSDDESDTYFGGFIAEDDTPTALDMLFDDRQGLAEEETSIDRMLPTLKRKTRTLSGQPRKRRRTGLDTLSGKGVDRNARQPKITEHLGGAPQRQRKQGKSQSLGVFGTKTKSQSKRTRVAAPRLSILDAADYNATNKQLPQFVRIAARTARSRKGQGRHSPTKKFIKMFNVDDTLEAQKVLQDWRNGRIQPKHGERQRSNSNDTARRALQSVVGNKQTKLPTSTKKTSQGTSTTSAQIPQVPRRLFIIKPRQTSISGFVTPGEPIPVPETPQAQPESPQRARSHQKQPRSNISITRPAQLESSDAGRSTQGSESFFKTSKRSLDVIFRDLRRRHGVQANPQLGKYLADDSIRPTMELDDEASRTVSTEKTSLPVSRRKKNQPIRVDVDAAKYRQPSEPIILQRFTKQETTNKNGKLQGLGKLGTRYPIHFDILPFNNAVYFHESSFIGSGRLSEVIGGVRIPNCTDGVRHSFVLDSKTFRWDQWNETVSSEIGVCFDWMIEQACSPQPRISNADPVSVIAFISGYIQHHVAFRTPHDQVDFLSRMSEIFADILSRLNGIHAKPPCGQWIEIFTRCTIVVYQLLQMARKIPEGAALSYDFEDLLKRVAKMAVRLLVADGLDNIRRLYDDLQYLSFREMGLKNKQSAIQGWVILIKILDSSRIPRGTFWDIVGPELSEPSIHEVSDVPALENWWYSMFTLLPLFGFDELGIVNPNLRNHTSSDNWALPQKLLKRVFELYKLNSHQPPGFNDYCRANLARCHYLMVEWRWWKCSGLIGTVFDFFADQKLANLRNEEVYDSPRFLRELDEQPSLSLQPEDICFHILLKIVGLALRQMGQSGDIKGVRNLVTRLLPNHNREFPKEESIHHRELASLRNHHDLLCTLYWAAPSQQRPSPLLIQDLVVADRSHKEACLINLRAWGNLTRVVVSEPVNIPAYNPFTNWQNFLCTALAKQYLGTEAEVRAQAESASEAEKATMIIAINKKSTMETLRVIVKIMGYTVNAATSAQMATLAFNPAVLCTLCSQEICEDSVFPEGLIGDSIVTIHQYLAQIDKLEPIIPLIDRNGIEGDGESQESDTMSFLLGRWEMIHRLQPEIVPLLRTIITKGLQESSKMSPQLLSDAVACWAHLVTKMTEGTMRMKDFVTTGAESIFQYRHSSKKALAYWPVFLGELLEHKDLDDLKIPGFDIGAQWLLSITMPSSIIALSFGAVDMLTARLRSKGHYLIAGNLGLASCSTGTSSAGRRTPDTCALFESAIDTMRTALLKQSNVDLILENISLKRAHTMFASTLKQVMESMKIHLESMTSGSKEHLEYVEFVQRIASIIRSYASDIQPLMDFFVQSSIYYWPEDTDPNMYAAGVVSYSLRLAKDPSRTSPQLLHYLYNGWRKDIVQGHVKQHMNHVKNGMKHWEFTEFLLLEFIPAALHVGFRWAGGWALCATYLPLLSNRLIRILHGEGENANAALEGLINLLRKIINELSELQRGVDASSTALANHLYIAHTVFQFWFSIALPIKVFTSSLPDASKSVDDIECSMMKIISQACHVQDREPIPNLEIPVTSQITQGAQFENFVSVLTQDLSENWEVANNGYEVEIGSIRARETSRTRVDLRHLLGECLTLKQLLRKLLMAMPFLGNVPGIGIPVEKMKGPMVGDIYF